MFALAPPSLPGDTHRKLNAVLRLVMCPVTCLPQAKHKSYFGPFITGNYDGYLSEMSRLGTWGGHVELQVCFSFKLLCFALLCFALLCFRRISV